jgi:uncharacterized protein (TIRG00374 family)
MSTPAARKRWRSVITAGIGLVLIVAVFAFIFPQFANYQQAFEQLRQMSAWWLLALLVAAIVNNLAYPLTAQAAIPKLPYRVAFTSRQVSFLVSNVIPGGGAIAAGSQYSVLATYRIPTPMAAAAVTADAVWTLLITLAAPSLAIVLLITEGRSTLGYTTIAVIALTITVVVMLLTAIVLRSEDGAARIGRVLERPAAAVFRIIRRPAPDLSASLVAFHEQAAAMVGRRWAPLTLTNLLAQFMPMVILICALAGLGVFPKPLSLIEVFAAFSIAILLTSVPITPGGLGTVDAALVALLVAFGADSSTALAADLIWRVFWTLTQLGVGLFAFGLYGWDRRRVKHQESAP